MLEYIAQNNIFWILWIIILVGMLITVFSFIRIAGIYRFIISIVPFILILFVCNIIASDMLITYSYTILIFIRDMWFLVGPSMLFMILSFNSDEVSRNMLIGFKKKVD